MVCVIGLLKHNVAMFLFSLAEEASNSVVNSSSKEDNLVKKVDECLLNQGGYLCTIGCAKFVHYTEK